MIGQQAQPNEEIRSLLDLEGRVLMEASRLDGRSHQPGRMNVAAVETPQGDSTNLGSAARDGHSPPVE